LSKVELESFLKSFLLFFISLGTLLGILFYLNYQKDVQTLDEQLFSQMRVCSFDLPRVYDASMIDFGSDRSPDCIGCTMKGKLNKIEPINIPSKDKTSLMSNQSSTKCPIELVGPKKISR